ncbi:peptidoglycan-binding protein [Planosporangium flavigriseum]|uniref:Peptidoglycan-binding protein n=1 Tax=Planosporangium flavigriseum TaxID=373681 RepID=A0A8J3LJ53_9ACTN|nr:peptidoglycan-binding protein [Planosporangium flavigriseum]NJC64996.1 peptidoglycan-binding protein [Planosporangium flavigriseum]GIG71608.1 hypothetical protein Pfl04_00120 [Planosporangium flavigriseum]
MSEHEPTPLSPDEIAAEAATPLPPKEVMSILDLNADLDLALHAAAPIDLAVAANANVAAPINAAVGANVLSLDSKVGSLADQAVSINQGISGDAIAHAPQDSTIDQAQPAADQPGAAAPADPAAAPAPAAPAAGVGAVPTDPAQMLDGDLLNVNVNAALDAKLAAPINGAVAANANVAAPIDASVGANVASIGSEATSVANQTAIIDQHLDGVTAEATADQKSSITQ